MTSEDDDPVIGSAMRRVATVTMQRRGRGEAATADYTGLAKQRQSSGRAAGQGVGVGVSGRASGSIGQ